MSEKELSWDSPIQNDDAGGEYTLLPPGNYPFQVLLMERKRHTPSATGKLPACWKAELKIRVGNDEVGYTECKSNLFLHSKCEGLLCQFFTSIGQRKHGEQLVPRWQEVPGSTGMCTVTRVPGYKDPTKEYNQIDKFLDPVEDQPIATAAPDTDDIPF